MKMNSYASPLCFKLIYVVFFLLSCKEKDKPRIPYGDIGDIYFNPNIDDHSFKVCNEHLSIQFNYHRIGLIYEGEKTALIEHFKKNYNHKIEKGQSGYITIRFVINCEGKPGRFRISEMDFDLTEKKISSRIKEKLLTTTKNAPGWVIYTHKGKPYDYYQYLVFKIQNGQIEEILP